MSFSFGPPKANFTLPTTVSTTTSTSGSAGDTKSETAKSTSTLFGTPSTAIKTVVTTTTTPAFSVGGLSTATTTTSTTASVSLATVASTSTGLGGLATSITTQAQPVTSSVSALPTTSGLTYGQLEDSINKWTIDLEDQGKFFINQAKQLNAWDSLLVLNGEKIISLNETIERIKQEQEQLDQELDFVLAQQKELDELSAPLEKKLADVAITDHNRFQTYQMSEIIDSQLKQMSEDLKEIVEHLNESNKNEDISDPVVQIGRILNAHNSSLEWIDRSTTQITSQLEQVAQLQVSFKENRY